MNKLLVLIACLLLTLSAIVRADTYLSNDTLRLGVATYDTATYQTLTNADSVVWYRINYSGTRQRLGAQTTGNQETGVYTYMVAACSASSASYAGFYAAYVKAYGVKTAAKIDWSWKAVPGSGLRVLSANDSTALRNQTVGTATNLTGGVFLLAFGLNADTGWVSVRSLIDAAISSRSTFNPATTRVHTYPTDSLGYVADIRNGDTVRVDLSNSFGTLAAARFAADYWHDIAVYADSGATGTGSEIWTAAELDSIMRGRWRFSGDSSNVLLAAGDSVRAYLAPGDSGKLAAIKAKTDKMKFYGTAPNDSAIYSYGINATGTAPTAYENAQALIHYPLDSTFTQWLFGWYIHSRLDTNMATRSTFNPATTRVHTYNTDSLSYVTTLYALSSQALANIWTEDTTGLATGWAQFFKTFKPLQAQITAESLNTRYTLSQLMVLAKILNGGQYRQRYYRPAATDAPDSLRIFSGTTLVARQLYWYNASGKLDSVRTYSY